MHAPDIDAALNEGRGVNPGDTGLAIDALLAAVSALNEGRGVNPGDTPTRSRLEHLVVERSTKAGA